MAKKMMKLLYGPLEPMVNFTCDFSLVCIPVADLRGHEGRAPPLPQNFFIFMQFSGKIGQIIGWRSPLGLAPPPLGNPGSATAFRRADPPC